MRVHLVDGTYELFRHFYGGPDARKSERAAVIGVAQSIIGMLEGGATHVGVATDHVIESFRNGLYAGYKTGEGIDPLLWAQFEPLEAALAALGVVVWPMVEVEADDALAAAAAAAAADTRVKQVFLCTPDNESGVMEKFGVPPASIPDYLALVGDSADGYPGLPGWGPKAASAVLAKYQRLEKIPASAADWKVTMRGAERLAETLRERRDDAFLFRTLATLRTDQPVVKVDDLQYRGPKPGFEALASEWGRPKLFARAEAIAESG